MYVKNLLSKVLGVPRKDLEKAPEATVNSHGEITVSTYHYLTKVVELGTDDVTQKINAWLTQNGIEHIDEDALRSAFPDWGISSYTANVSTTNLDSILDNDIQFQIFYIDGWNYVLLRGIYGVFNAGMAGSAVRCFSMNNSEVIDPLPFVYGTIEGVNVDNDSYGYSLGLVDDEDGEELFEFADTEVYVEYPLYLRN